MASIPVLRKKRGRPATGVDPILNFRADDALREAISLAMAHAGQSSRSEYIRSALTDHLRAKGYLSSESTNAALGTPESIAGEDRYADADPDEAVMVSGVGPMILRRAVRKRIDWRDHHGLGLVSVFRGADKEPGVFDMADLGRLAEMDRFR